MIYPIFSHRDITIYDLLGYLFPGIFRMGFGYSAYILYSKANTATDYGFVYSDLQRSLSDITVAEATFFLLISYALGHILAYCSSMSVEFFANKVFEYPSKYLLLLEDDENIIHGYWKRYFLISVTGSSEKKVLIKGAFKTLFKVFILIAIFPVSLFTFSIGRLCGINNFITRTLDPALKKRLREKEKKTLTKLGIAYKDKRSFNVPTQRITGNKIFSECENTHRVIMHYVYYNIESSRQKAGNYISLYGFLRSMTFVFCIVTLFILTNAIYSIFLLYKEDFSFSILLSVLIAFAVSNIFFLGFVKYYRRYTLENYMALLTFKSR